VKDENNNIHLSSRLVTCGEYQPFLDEIRAQRKYYQPDHWASTRFPDGQTDEPVLGVRSSDAVAYCQWLTERDNDGWSFRLPTVREGVAETIKIPMQNSLGYWVSANNEQNQLNWIGTAPANARELDLVRAFALSIESIKPDVDERERARSHAYDLLRLFELEQILKRPLDLDHDLSLARGRARENASILQSHPAPDLAMRLDQSLDRDFDRAIDLSRALERGRERSEAIEHACHHALMHALEPGHRIDRSIMIDLFIYVDLLTLQERIAGRSPAFEGIRVVNIEPKGF